MGLHSMSIHVESYEGDIVETSGLDAGSLGQLQILGEGLNSCSQGNVGWVMVVACQGGGGLAQGASGTSCLSRWVVGRVRGAGVGAVDKWVVDAGGSGSGESTGCRVDGAERELCLLLHGFGWERVPGQVVRSPEVGRSEPIILVIKRIGRGWARMRAGGRNRVGGRGLVADMMLVEGIWCPEGSVCWCVVVYQPLHHITTMLYIKSTASYSNFNASIQFALTIHSILTPWPIPS